MSGPPSPASYGSPSAPLPSEVDVLVVGGGIMGLATAYHLTRKSSLRVCVIESDYLVSGASGRNGGGVRMQWGDPGNVALMQESVRMCRSLAQELGINLWFRQGGYLFLARHEADEARLIRNHTIHRELGARTRLLGPGEAAKMVPEADFSGVRVAAFNPDDGVVFPWPFVWGYTAQAAAAGATIRTHTRVERLTPEGSGYLATMHTGETLLADTVVNATGAWCHGLNRSLGIELPNRPQTHEIFSSEPLKAFLEPLVVDLAHGLYVSQSTRGELVAGVTHASPSRHGADPLQVSMDSSLSFLLAVSRALTSLLPLTRSVRVLRQWAGPYDVSPDGDPIVGPSPGHPKVLQLCGFTGHGFMMGPAVGKIVARWIQRAESHPMLDRWNPGRFAEGQPRAPREDMIIG